MMHRDRLSVKHSGREDDPILFPNGERERGEIATRPSSSVDASFPRAKTNELCRRNNSYSLGKDDLWTVQFDAIAISSSFPSLAESRFLFPLLSLSSLLSASFHNQAANPLSRASSYLVPWKSLSPLLSFLELLLETLSLGDVSLLLSLSLSLSLSLDSSSVLER